jgi:cytochrome d ubiquinol oxidase subunit II
VRRCFRAVPTLLPSTTDPANAINIRNAAAGSQSLAIGLIWWSIGMAVALGYFVLVVHDVQGKSAASGARTLVR